MNNKTKNGWLAAHKFTITGVGTGLALWVLMFGVLPS